METTLILGALGALLFCGLMVVSLLMRGRRPELRMGREVDLIDEAVDEETLMRSLEPPRPSPIDRTAPILEIEPADDPETRRFAPDTHGEKSRRPPPDSRGETP